MTDDQRITLITSTQIPQIVRRIVGNALNIPLYKIRVIKPHVGGGFKDWRLPTPDELTTLFKVTPYFPAADGTWLWTSKVLKKYEGEWLLDVTIVTADNKPATKKMVKDSRYCGNVRAVRRPR